MEIVALTKDELNEMLRQAAMLAVSHLRADLERRTPELMEKKDLAIYLKVHPSTINRHMQNGMPFELCGEHPRFRKTDIDLWLKGEYERLQTLQRQTGHARFEGLQERDVVCLETHSRPLDS